MLLAFLGIALVGGLVVTLVLASIARTRAEKRFGEPSLVGKLVTHDAAGRRATKGTLLVLGLALFLFALARPQYGRGTRLVPARALDVVVVLDFSKSMYARDIAPSRIVRAKAEVARLVQSLPGARFGAVAFAGEPISFPLTGDGAAIAQFFRQLEPNDMPVGGTATARAIERAREVFARDPRAKSHARVIVVVTDGEDLEGDPVVAARAAAADGIRIDVVQIGGRNPEVIPDVGPDGRVVGPRRDETGKPLTTQLTTAGETQLAAIAREGSGTVIRSERGQTGIEKITQSLSRSMKEELSERVETVYGEAYATPLALGALVLLLEALLLETPARRRRKAKKTETSPSEAASPGKKEKEGAHAAA
jgi:Ca-activated chloride channel family protein